MSEPTTPAGEALRVTAELLETDALTGNDEGTPTHYTVHADDVQYLVETVLRLAAPETEPAERLNSIVAKEGEFVRLKTAEAYRQRAEVAEAAVARVRAEAEEREARVRALHRRVPAGASHRVDWCAWDAHPWPCDTVRALDEDEN